MGERQGQTRLQSRWSHSGQRAHAKMLSVIIIGEVQIKTMTNISHTWEWWKLKERGSSQSSGEDPALPPQVQRLVWEPRSTGNKPLQAETKKKKKRKENRTHSGTQETEENIQNPQLTSLKIYFKDISATRFHKAYRNKREQGKIS